MDSRIRRVAKRVIKRAAENKVSYGYINKTVDAATGFYQALVPVVSQGPGYYQRIGSQINVTSMTFRGYLRMTLASGGTATTSVSKVRIAFITFKQTPPASLNNLNSIMEDFDVNNDANGINSSFDPEFVNVLKDKTYIMGNQTNQYMNTGRFNEIQVKFHMKMNKKWNYITSGSDVASDATKIVYYIVFTEHAATGNFNLYNYASYKVNFNDI